MARTDPFSPMVAGRTRAAQTILAKAELLTAFEAMGGLREDLERIATEGLRAEAANGGQSLATAHSGAATIVLLQSFDAVRDQVLRS